jgi:murein DD-endopeptidase MepM/ murein hydrolase activator NlpD
VQRFLAQGRTAAAWRVAVERFGAAFQRYFNNELIRYGGVGSDSPVAATPEPPSHTAAITLLQPWPTGLRVVHLAYFDHVYPTVDSGDDGNSYVVNYMGQGSVQYDGHDGHDFYFPEQPVGTPILAAAAGVAYARTHRGNGVVILHPNGYETVYWHLNGFSPIFAGKIDSSEGVPIAAGEFLGVSGATGFVSGTPHLHFEVRRYGREVDPYGWQGAGPDPCAAYAGCLASDWLWAPSLAGTFDFTPPTAFTATDGASAATSGTRTDAPATQPTGLGDTTPPIGTLTVNPPDDMLFAADFNGHVVQSVGQGFPTLSGPQRFTEGRADQALVLGAAGLTYPVTGNLQAAAGTLSLWADLPASYPTGRVPRHYLFATSANPDDAPVYSGTLALRHDATSPDGGPMWTFWTTASDEASRNMLAAPDTLEPGWHHFAITWDAAAGHKAIYIDGTLAAETMGATLPVALGEVMQMGRFTYGGGQSGVTLDDLAIYRRALSPVEVAALAVPHPPAAGPLTVGRNIRVDTNASDDQGGIVAVQLGLDGTFEDPQPYYESYRWTLSAAAGPHELAVRYVDRAGNTATVTSTIQLDLAPDYRLYLPDMRR